MNKSSKDIKQDAKILIIQNLQRILVSTLLFIIVCVVIDILTGRLSGYDQYLDKVYEMAQSGVMEFIPWPTVKLTAAILTSLLGMLRIILNAGYQGYALNTSRGQESGFRDMIPQGGLMVKILIINFLTSVITAVGFILLIVPGFMLHYRYSQAIYVMFDNPEMSSIECMRTSARIMKGHKMARFKLDLSFIPWHIASAVISAILLPVLDIWITPYTAVSYSMFYNGLLSPAQNGTAV